MLEPHDDIGDDDKDITTGGTTRFQRVLSGVQAGYDTTWPATRVGLRPVKAGLGGHEEVLRAMTRGSRMH